MDLAQQLSGVDLKNVGKGIEVPRPSPGQFLKDFIVNQLPKHVVTNGLSLIGRDDGSGMMAYRALKAGQDPNFLGGILR
jgi:hypothetical protein